MRRTLQPVRLSVDMPAILAYAEITGDFNPLHVDPVFAATTPMGGVIAHGTMSLNLVWQAIASTFGAAVAARSAIDVRFVRPVRVGDVVEAGGTESAERPGEFDVWVRNQEGIAVIEGSATLPAAPVPEAIGSAPD
ncbi:MaoC family dehydratase [Quisquiliibacterium transsilvanicum]|uniref:Acyl dehydratase n=1 Tax=Quisquiliibacterium transsilvanicum TaxID=1549638 RepID=A0A7W8HHH6_9BURK|nr:MaoC family dehydratase [Quisquiliibacterium transsilvanicum]MBB5272139.1 acyl dehydratase [Quisquiliibacterium transsilvanicum]